jgi:tyrosyl-tRNA synthetase
LFRFLKLFTDLDIEEINAMANWEGQELNQAKIILADEATKLLHGKECLPTIHATTQSLFGSSKGGDLDSLPKIDIDLKADNNGEDSGITILDLLLRSKFASSKAEARRLISGGGARINDAQITDEKRVVTCEDFDDQGRMKLSSGKKKHIVISMQKDTN